MLESLKELDVSDLDVTYLFLDNNSTDKSVKLLEKTVYGKDPKNPAWPNSVVMCTCPDDYEGLPPYLRHPEQGMDQYVRLCKVRDEIRKFALGLSADYLFTFDSDLMLQPSTLKRLLSHELDYVAATVSNSRTEKFNVVNAVGLVGNSNIALSDPPRWFTWRYTGKGVNPVGATGACYLMSKRVIEECDYFPEIKKGSKYAGLPFRSEDLNLAMSCGDKGIDQYLDEEHRVWHCFTSDLLDRYLAAREEYGPDTVRVLTDKAWEDTVTRATTSG